MWRWLNNLNVTGQWLYIRDLRSNSDSWPSPHGNTACNGIENEESMFHPSSIFLTQHLTCYILPVVEMAHFSNAIIYGGTFNSAQGDLHINNRHPESGMHDFRSVRKSILIDDPMKDFIS